MSCGSELGFVLHRLRIVAGVFDFPLWLKVFMHYGWYAVLLEWLHEGRWDRWNMGHTRGKWEIHIQFSSENIQEKDLLVYERIYIKMLVHLRDIWCEGSEWIHVPGGGGEDCCKQTGRNKSSEYVDYRSNKNSVSGRHWTMVFVDQTLNYLTTLFHMDR
jgi:hypothetical protein